MQEHTFCAPNPRKRLQLLPRLKVTHCFYYIQSNPPFAHTHTHTPWSHKCTNTLTSGTTKSRSPMSLCHWPVGFGHHGTHTHLLHLIQWINGKTMVRLGLMIRSTTLSYTLSLTHSLPFPLVSKDIIHTHRDRERKPS